MGLCLCPQLVFPSIFFQGIGFTQFGGKTKSLYVLPTSDCLFAMETFDPWMSMGALDIFTLVVNFINVDWQPKQVIIGLFKVPKTTSQAMALKLQTLLDKYKLMKKILTYLKNNVATLALGS